MIAQMLVASGIISLFNIFFRWKYHFVEITTLVCTVCQFPTFYFHLLKLPILFSNIMNSCNHAKHVIDIFLQTLVRKPQTDSFCINRFCISALWKNARFVCLWKSHMLIYNFTYNSMVSEWPNLLIVFRS